MWLRRLNLINWAGRIKMCNALLTALARKVAEDGREFITIYYGEDTTEEQAQKAQEIFSECCADADINLIRGGQPVYYFMISAE